VKKLLGVSPSVKWGGWKPVDPSMLRSRKWKGGPEEFGIHILHWPIFYCFVKKPRKGYAVQDFYAVSTVKGKRGAVPFQCTYNRAVAFWAWGWDLYYITGRYLKETKA
jgi:hypothetical protein